MGAALFALIDDIGTAQEFGFTYTVIFYGIGLITTSEIDHLLLQIISRQADKRSNIPLNASHIPSNLLQ